MRESPADPQRLEGAAMSAGAEPEIDVAPAIDQPFGLKRTFSALRHRNYRLWFAGQLVSLLGTWMQITAQGYFVYELTRSPAYLGYVGFAAGLPAWFLMPLAGVVADRVARRTMLLVTQAAMMVLATVLAAITLAGVVQPWHVVALAFLLGAANAFDGPARQAFVAETVSREDLTNAIALNSTMFNVATALGPAAAGVAYAALGPGFCFAVNAASFLAVIGALLLMHLTALPPAAHAPVGRALAEGFRYVIGHAAIRTIVLLMVVTSLFGLAFATLVPAWAVEVLHGDARTAGLLQAARGGGAMAAALTIASLGTIRSKGRLLTAGTFLYPSLLLLLPAIDATAPSLVVLFGVGFGMMMLFNMANALIQTHVPDGLRGRVMSIYMLAFFGFMPLGALLAGGMAEQVGERATLAAGSAVALLGAIATWLTVPALRRME